MSADNETQIVQQLEYYFGDINLPRDKFMQEQIKVDDGWIPIDVLLTFKRLLKLTDKPDVIASSIENAKSELIHVSEDKKKLRRNPEKPTPELDENRKKELLSRTAYAKGFPLEENLDDIIKFLEPYGPVESCYKRSYLDRATKEHKFKGSCFIIFKDVETCKKFVEDKSIKYKDQELIRKMQEAYYEEKKLEMQKLRQLKKKVKTEVVDEESEKKIQIPKGAILKISGISKDNLITREEIKKKITVVGNMEPAYIDYNKGDEEGYVRLPKKDAAVEFKEMLGDGTLEVGENKLEIQVLEGEEEEEYLKKTVESMSQRKKLFKKGNKNFKRRSGQQDGPRSKRARK